MTQSSASRLQTSQRACHFSGKRTSLTFPDNATYHALTRNVVCVDVRPNVAPRPQVVLASNRELIQLPNFVIPEVNLATELRGQSAPLGPRAGEIVEHDLPEPEPRRVVV